MQRDICKLCLKERTLLNSHIVPEFLYSKLYNDKRQLMGINGIGGKGWRPLQKGIREHLFCSDCEQHFNETCENPFFSYWVRGKALPDKVSTNYPVELMVDYKSFKLLHLSILFRADVSTLATFKEVKLGSHRERLRQMILDGDPGPFWQYPIAGLVVVNPPENTVFDLVSRPFSSMYEDSLRVYSTIYGGVQWSIGVASHRNQMFEALALNQNGEMKLYSSPFNELSIIKEASHALRIAEKGYR